MAKKQHLKHQIQLPQLLGPTLPGLEGLAPAPEAATESISVIAHSIGATAANHNFDVDATKPPINPTLADLGWTSRETLSVDPPLFPKPPENNGKRSRSQIARDAIGPRRGEEEGVGYPGGLPHYYLPRVELSPEQMRAFEAGMAQLHEITDGYKARKAEAERAQPPSTLIRFVHGA